MRTRIALLVLLSVTFASLGSAQQPTALLPDPVKDALINDQFKFCVTFHNAGTAPGYAPFIDLLMPRDPMNGNSPCDGIKFLSAAVTSTTPNVPLTPEPVVPGNCTSTPLTANHPFQQQGVGPMSLGAGMQLVTLALPFGSYQPLPQPKIFVEVTASVAAFADVNAPLTISVRGGFRYGNNPGPGPAIVQSGWQTQTITPRVVILHNTYSGNDQETVAGPNFPQPFTVTADVAPGQVLSGLTLQQCMFSGGVWGGSPAIVPPPTNWGNAGSCYAVNYASITGTGAGTITVKRPSTIDNTLLGTTNCSAPMTNGALLSNGTWQPADPLDPLVQLMATPAANTVIDVKALATQKLALPGPTTPGNVITYDIPFQVSDYSRFDDLVITDTMSDGLKLVSASLTVTDKFGTATVPPFSGKFLPKGQPVKGSFTCPPSDPHPCKPAGPAASGVLPSTQYVFKISAILQGAGHSGVLIGGWIGGPSTVTAHGVLTLKVQILDAFLYGNHAGMDDKVDKDDPLLNHVDISGQDPKTGVICTDEGNSCLAVPGDILHKEVVAVNGVYQTPTTLGGPNVTVGDRITFRLSKQIPSGDAESLSIQDWYPLPVIQAQPVTMPICSPFIPVLTITPDCYASAFPMVPPSPPASDNSLGFVFGTFDDPNNQPADITVYTTHTISNLPFADGLLLTNEAQECEKNSFGETFCQAAIAQFQLQEPRLEIRKGVCSIGCGKKLQTCPSCPATTFNATTVAALLGSSTVNVDANDHVQFAIVVENTGSGPLGAHDVVISDLLGATFPGQMTYSNFCVRRGDGAPVAWSFNGTNQPKSFSLSLANPLPGSASAATGANVILILYDVLLNTPQNVLSGCYKNKGHIAHYANSPGGPDFVAAGYAGPDATAWVCIQPYDLKKLLKWGSETDPLLANVAIGELVDYELSVIVPEGKSTFTMIDNLPAGLNMQAGTTATVSGVGFTPGIIAVPNSGTAAQPKFAFTNLLNPNNNWTCERLNVRFRAQVMNTALTANSNGVVKENTFSIGDATSNKVQVTILEPKLDVQKKVKYFPGPAGLGSAQYTVSIKNISTTTAFNITVKDTMPACMTVPANLIPSVGVPAGVTWGGNLALLTISSLKPGQAATIGFQAKEICRDCTKLTNTVRVEWTSLPGPQGTGNITPGASGASNGERRGIGGAINNYFMVATASICGKVCGVKYADLNGNGLRDPNEPPLAGWAVNAGSVGTTTSATGNYCLELHPGSQSVCEGLSQYWTPTQPPVSPPCVPVTVSANTTTNVDFGNRPRCSATICGRKTTPPPNAQPVAGWTIIATSGQGGPTITATTQPDGSYCMTLFGPGSYTISEAPKTGWLQSVPASGTYQVKVDCVTGPAGFQGLITGANPKEVHFVNRNVCANVKCPALQHCEVGPNKTPICVNDNVLPN